MILYVAAVAFVAVLLFVSRRRSPTEQVATHVPRQTTRTPTPPSNLIGRQWAVAVAEMQASAPESHVVVLRRSPLRSSLEMPALSNTTYVFVHADGLVADIVTDARIGELLEHDGVVRNFAPIVVPTASPAPLMTLKPLK